MKRILYFLTVLILLLASFSFVYTNRDRYIAFFDSLHPCDKPITYRIDNVDKQFNLTVEQFKKDVSEAAGIWNNQWGKNLLVYDPNGKISVNMTFDERQQEQNAINSLDSRLKNQQNQLNSDIATYKQQVADFKNKLATYNSEVDKWNSQGGAPQDIYDRLRQEQQDLNNQGNQLNQEAKRLNLSTVDYNLQVGQLNSQIQNFNQDLAQKPEEGLFDGNTNKIDIYFNNSHAELVHTLAHELGHALALGHNDNKMSIMYPYTSSYIKLTADDISGLKTACTNKNILDVVRARLSSN